MAEDSTNSQDHNIMQTESINRAVWSELMHLERM